VTAAEDRTRRTGRLIRPSPASLPVRGIRKVGRFPHGHQALLPAALHLEANGGGLLAAVAAPMLGRPP